MSHDTATAVQLLSPTLLAVAFYIVAGPMADPMSRVWRAVIGLVTGAVLARYLDWRLFDTVLAPHHGPIEATWVWVVFAAEIITYGDAVILFLLFLKPTNRTAEADALAAELRAAPTGTAPGVDVLIATYNEPIDVLEKTIVGALSLDYPNFKVWVLDDGRREWLRDYCTERGVGYIIRPDNTGAKAGNINHALTKIDGAFFAIFDADFVPQQNFLIRTMGFFKDPKVGIVQVPHTFYNNDPFQTNLSLRENIPDDQRFFFETVMPCRDGWDVAFCCGSNSVTRREAMRAVGDQLPTGSITEDILLSMALLQKGYVTRYLCEPLALGLAPESVSAFFVQRQRWARGAIQTLFLKEGPLGGRRPLLQRIFFLPTAWLTQSLAAFVTLIIPIVFLLFGLSPVADVTWTEVVYYVLPVIVAMGGGITLCARGTYLPFAQIVLTALQCFKLLPTVISTFIKPHGHVFKVTPKGSAAEREEYESRVFWASGWFMILTVGGIVINAFPETRIVANEADLSVAVAWAAVNIVVLFLVCMTCVRMPVARGEERIPIAETVWIRRADGRMGPARASDVSATGVGVDADRMNPFLGDLADGEELSVALSEVGQLPAKVVRRSDRSLGLRFLKLSIVERDLLLRKAFTCAHNPRAVTIGVVQATLSILARIATLDFPALDATAAPADEAEAESRTPAVETKLAPESLAIQPWARDEISRAAASRRFEAGPPGGVRDIA